MKNDEIKSSFEAFLKVKDPETSNQLWEENSSQFRKFWNNYILDKNKTLSEDIIDQAIRILDVNAKGHRNEEAVAKVMVPQGAWRRLFNEMKQNDLLRDNMDEIFKSEGEKLVKAINQLYELNKDTRNYLTGGSANAINAMLFAFNPKSNLSVVSLNDRRKIIETFGFSNGPNFETDSPGNKILLSNKAIIDGFKSIGIEATPRSISNFLYHKIRDYWKPSIEIRINKENDEKETGLREVIVPEDNEIKSMINTNSIDRRSITIQAKLAEIGEKLGFKIWLPRSDRIRVLKVWKPKDASLLENLPVSFEEATEKTIMNIDVLWISKRTIIRAFEVEDTTSIYSGILRMADLLALQPNLNIKIHIVASNDRKDDVFKQIARPVFSLIDPKPLSEVCTFISYDSIEKLALDKNLENMKESIIDSISSHSNLTN